MCTVLLSVIHFTVKALRFELYVVGFTILANKSNFSSARGIMLSRVCGKNVPARVRNKGNLNDKTLLAIGSLASEWLQTVSNTKHIRSWGADCALASLDVLGTITSTAMPTR